MAQGRIPILVLLLGVAALLALDACLTLERVVVHSHAPSIVLGLRVASVGLVLVAAARTRRAIPAFVRRGLVTTTIASAMISLGLGLTAATLADHFEWVDEQRVAMRSVFVSGCALGGAAWLLMLGWRPVGRRLVGWRSWPRTVALALGIVVGLASIEVGLALWSTLSGSKVAFTDGPARERIARYRLTPGARHAGSRTNSLGFFDDEFRGPEPDAFVVALVADSFGVGIVPRPHNFVDVAERTLADSRESGDPEVLIHNLSVPAIGVPEYEWMMGSQATALGPDAAVVVVYPANDLPSAIPYPRRFYDPLEWRLGTVVGRVASVRCERLRGAPVAVPKQAEDSTPAERWVEPSEPTMSHDTYLGIVARQMRALDPGGRETGARSDALVAAFERMRARAPFPVAVVLAPSELDVSDALKAEVSIERPDLATLDTAVTHAALAARLRDAGFAVLDLLPVLRAAERTGRTHHPRDSHWNVWGNAVAGDALAQFIARVFADERDARDDLDDRDGPGRTSRRSLQ